MTTPRSISEHALPYVVTVHWFLTAFLGLRGDVRSVTLVFGSAYACWAAAAFVGFLGDRRGGSNLVFLGPAYRVVAFLCEAAFYLAPRESRGDAKLWKAASLLPLFAGISAIGAVAAAGQLSTVSVAIFWLLLACLAYTYVGYPALIWALSKFVSRSVNFDESYTPTVTLLVAAFNEESVMEDKLENSLKLVYPADKLRVLVASDGSTDRTAQIAKLYRDRGVEVLDFERNRGKVSALNDAMAQTTSEVIVLSDANVMYRADSIRKLVRNFADPDVGAVSGHVVLVNEGLSYGQAENRYYDVERVIQTAESATGSLVGADGAMYAIRKDLFEAPRSDTILDDFVISMGVTRKGYRLVYEPEARGYEKNIQEIEGELRRKTRIIAGGVQCLLTNQGIPPRGDLVLWLKFLSHKVLRWVSGGVWCGILSCCVAILATAVGPPLLIDLAAAVVIGVAVLALAGCLVPSLRSWKLVNLAWYLAMLNVASIQGCWKGLTGGQKVAWRAP